VTHGNRNYESKWWTRGDDPSKAGPYGAWKDIGACSAPSPAPAPAPAPAPSPSPTPAPSPSPSSDLTTLRILVTATPEAKANIADLDGLAQVAIAESNQGFENSKIKIRFELAGTYVVKNYTETGSYLTDLLRAIDKSDGYMDDLHTVRANTNANIVVLLLNARELCGRAYLKANAERAFATVGNICATGTLSFVHEIGHLLGAMHNPERQETNPYFDYGYGYIVPGKWRTIMAGECSSGGKCPRVNYWSSPNIFYQGRATGDSLHDNARVLEERRGTAATWR